MNNNTENFKPNEQKEISRPAQGRTSQQLKRDRMQAFAVMIVFGLIVAASVIYFVTSGNNNSKDNNSSASLNNKTGSSASSAAESVSRSQAESEQVSEAASQAEAKEAEGHNVEVINGRTYIDGILIVNKTYSIPDTYAPGLDADTEEAFYKMAGDAYADGIVLYICSGYRSYAEQEQLYNSYAAERGVEEADSVSSRPGHSEHQTGLCMDVILRNLALRERPKLSGWKSTVPNTAL